MVCLASAQLSFAATGTWLSLAISLLGALKITRVYSLANEYGDDHARAIQVSPGKPEIVLVSSIGDIKITREDPVDLLTAGECFKVERPVLLVHQNYQTWTLPVEMVRMAWLVK